MLSVFEWTDRKGWDVLVEAFYREYYGRTDVRGVMLLSLVVVVDVSLLA